MKKVVSDKSKFTVLKSLLNPHSNGVPRTLSSATIGALEAEELVLRSTISGHYTYDVTEKGRDWLANYNTPQD